MSFDLPTVEDWKSLEEMYWSEDLEISHDDFAFVEHPANSPLAFAGHLDLSTWHNHLFNRLVHIRWGYILMRFYYDKGIPDDTWIKPPEDGEIATKYFPEMEPEHHIRKQQFDFYASVFYFKLFSVWETLGHLLNIMYDLQLSRVSYVDAVKKLKKLRPELHKELNSLLDSPDFKRMRRLRNDIAHNESPSEVIGLAGRVSRHHITFGTGSYTTSREVAQNASKSLDILKETVGAIRKQVALDKEGR